MSGGGRHWRVLLSLEGQHLIQLRDRVISLRVFYKRRAFLQALGMPREVHDSLRCSLRWMVQH